MTENQPKAQVPMKTESEIWLEYVAMKKAVKTAKAAIEDFAKANPELGKLETALETVRRELKEFADTNAATIAKFNPRG